MLEKKLINHEVEPYLKVINSSKRPKLKNLFKHFNYTPHKMQEDIIEVWDNQYKKYPYVLMPSGRRLGKSLTAIKLASLELTIPNSSVILVSPSDKQLEIIFGGVVKNIKELGLPIEKIDYNKRVLKLQHGAEFYGGSEKTVQNLEGKKASLLIIEEAGLLTNLKQIFDSLKPALMTYGVYEDTKTPVGRIFILGTPKKNNLDYYELYLEAKKPNNMWWVKSYPSSTNPLNSKEFLENERKNMDKYVFQQEYEAKWVMVNTDMVFYSFDENQNTKDLTELKQLIDKNSFIVGGLDIGASDSTAYVLCYIENNKFYVFDYFSVNNTEEELIAKHIKDLEAKYKLESVTRFIDPSAKLTRLGLANSYNVSCYNAQNSIKESISLINQLFRQNRLIIDNNLFDLLKQIQILMWSENRKGNDPFKRIKGHHFDLIASLRYAIFTAYKIYMSNETEVVVI